MRPRRLRRLLAVTASLIVLTGAGVGFCARPALAEHAVTVTQ